VVTDGGVYLYPTIEAMAAHLAFSLIKNHAFLDGNKRIGMLAMAVFLELNNKAITYTDDELFDLGLGLATGTFDEENVILWIENHSN
jgi:death-on-curing protein